MSAELVEAVRLLRAAQPYLGHLGEEDVSYGYFLGGDPRLFTPDSDSTEEEIAHWKADCEAWSRGERPVHKVRTAIDPERSIAGQLKGSDSALLIRDDEGNVTGGHVHRAGYGLGTNVIPDEEGAALKACIEAFLLRAGGAP